MKSMPLTSAVALAAIATIVCAAQPATAPALRLEHLPTPPAAPGPYPSGVFGSPAGFGAAGIALDGPKIRVYFADPAETTAQAWLLNPYLANVRLVHGDLAYALIPDLFNGNSYGLKVILLAPTVPTGTMAEVQPKAEDVVAALNADLKPDPTLPLDARRAAIAQKQAALDEVLVASGLLDTLLNTKPPEGQRPLAERLTEWRRQAAKLQEQIDDKETRLTVLRGTRERLEAQQIAAQRADPVVVELKKIVDLRKQKLARVEKTVAASVASDSELADAKLAVSEAELRLAERSAAVVPSGTAASLDQLGQELVKLSVDYDELRGKLEKVQRRLAPYNLSNATTQSLAKVARLDAASEDEVKARKLSDDLNRQAAELREELLRLKVVKIEAE